MNGKVNHTTFYARTYTKKNNITKITWMKFLIFTFRYILAQPTSAAQISHLMTTLFASSNFFCWNTDYYKTFPVQPMSARLPQIPWCLVFIPPFTTKNPASHSPVKLHYNYDIMSAMASQITSLTIVSSAVYSGTDQRKHQRSAPLAFVRGIRRWPYTRKTKLWLVKIIFWFV